MKKKIGLIVNPVAGMGGSVGLKGTDGEMYQRALALGANPVTPVRTRDFLSHIKNSETIEWYVAPGRMGEMYVEQYSNIIGTSRSGVDVEATTGEDTKRIAEEMIAHGVDLLVFVGGDGTARDIYDVLGLDTPVVAVPSGVKVFSAVFAVSAKAAAEIVDAFVEGTDVEEHEVLDIDEAEFQKNRLASHLYGYLLVPKTKGLHQRGKEQSSATRSTAESKKAMAAYIAGRLHQQTLYLLGPGTTVKAICDEVGIEKTLLGVDAMVDRKRVGEDLNERSILALMEQYKKTSIIVTPIGGNGFIFGRGNKQFTSEVVKKAGTENIIIVATPDKVQPLEALHVDTGDEDVDRTLAGYVTVIVGENETMKMEVRC